MTRLMVGSVLVLLLSTVFAACGGVASSTSGPDGGSSGSLPDRGSPTSSCGACVENACCTLPPVPDGFEEVVRCVSGAWRTDDSCLLEGCTSPLTGSLLGDSGLTLAVSCNDGGFTGGVPGIALRIGSREVMQLSFDRVPAAGDVVNIVPFAPGPFLSPEDAGTSRRAMFRIGQSGGFAGYSVSAEGLGGTLKISSIETEGTRIVSLHASIDAKTSTAGGSGRDPWGGALRGSW